MYPYPYPHTIFNAGEELTFEKLEVKGGEETIIVTNKIKPNHGPPLHVHFLQDEAITVKKGRMGYQVVGEEETYLEAGESLRFEKGMAHRFWNAGEDILECSGWITPAHSIDYFLTSVYAAMSKSGSAQGDPFDMAYLITRYRKEYDLLIIPVFVKRIIMPLTVIVGKLLRKYDHFKDAPAPLK